MGAKGSVKISSLQGGRVVRHRPRLCQVTLLIGATCTAASCRSDALGLYTAEPVAFTTLEGLWESQSGFTERQRIVVRTPEHLAQVWEQLEALLSEKTSPPPVDFEHHIVLVAAMGRPGSLGYQIQIAGVFERGDELLAVVLESSVGTPVCYISSNQSPTTVVVVPRTSGKVSFIEREDLRCQPRPGPTQM
jgi:hypothetical protein